MDNAISLEFWYQHLKIWSFYCFSWLVWREILVFLFWEKAINSSLSVGGGGLLLTAAATAEEKILLREGMGLTWKALSFLWSRSKVSRSAPLDWVNFSVSFSLSCLSFLFSSNKAWNWLKSDKLEPAAVHRSKLEKGSEHTKSTPKSGLDKSVPAVLDLAAPPRDEEGRFRGVFSDA